MRLHFETPLATGGTIQRRTLLDEQGRRMSEIWLDIIAYIQPKHRRSTVMGEKMVAILCKADSVNFSRGRVRFVLAEEVFGSDNACDMFF